MLSELVSPAVANQMAYYRQLGLRSRVLNLPLMVAVVLTMLWRQVPYFDPDHSPSVASSLRIHRVISRQSFSSSALA